MSTSSIQTKNDYRPHLSSPMSTATTGLGFYNASSGSLAGVMQVGQFVDSTIDGGAYVVSPNGQYVVVFQPKANLVFYEVVSGTVGPNTTFHGKALWASNTINDAGGHLHMYPNPPSIGNLVVNWDNGQHFGTKTIGTMAGLYVQNNGELVIYEMAAAWTSSNNIPVPGVQTITLGTEFGSASGLGWSGQTGVAANVFGVGDTLEDSFAYIPSPNQKYFLVMQNDSNLVMYQLKSGTIGNGNTVTADPIWASNTQGKGATAFTLTTDGKMQLNTTGGTTTIDPSVSGNTCGLYVQDDGNLVLYNQTEAWVAPQQS